VVLALAVADVLYRWVELPMIEVGRRLAARVSRPGPRDGDGSAPAPEHAPVETVQIPRPREVLPDTVPAAQG
jgi:peptidoglycan/LPS O-acetylase OafA/YrhL